MSSNVAHLSRWVTFRLWFLSVCGHFRQFAHKVAHHLAINGGSKIVRTGVLYKKGKKTGVFGRENWKPRYCVLTRTKLQYYTCEGGTLKGELDLTACSRNSIAIMPNDCKKTGRSASSIWRVAISTPKRRFVIALPTEFEMREWIRDLVDVVMPHEEEQHDNPMDAVIYRRPMAAARVRPSLLGSMDVLSKSNRRNIALVPASVHLRRELLRNTHLVDDYMSDERV
ncbi:unnamed protein product [Aphanomyces euteiches]